jgi:hypothetical protein
VDGFARERQFSSVKKPDAHLNFWRSLIAVLAGNLIYLGVERYLPPRAQHQLYQIDWGLAVDFWFCLACYGIVRFFR